MRKHLLDASGKATPVQAGESSDVVVTFVGLNSVQIAKATIATLTATLFDATTGSIINSRNAQSVLDANGGAVASDGTLTLRLQPADAVIVGDADEGETEEHVLRLTWTWSDGVLTRTGVQEWLLLVEQIAQVA
jgi:hypothetical protein